MYYDIELVANPDVLKTMNELSQCSICTGLVIDPKQCDKCENAFCRECVDSWVKKSSSCPFKCENANFKEAGRALKTMINKLILKCPLGCPKTFSYENLKSHVCDRAQECIKVCPCCGTKVESFKIKEMNNGVPYEKIKQLEDENQRLKEEKNCLETRIEQLLKEKLENDFDKKLQINDQETKLRDSIIQHNIIFKNRIDKNFKENIFVLNKPKKVPSKDIYEEMKYENRKKGERLDNYDNKEFACKHKCKRNLRKGMIYLFSCCEKIYQCKKCHNESSNHYAIKPNIVICLNCNIKISSNILTCERCNSYLYLEPNIRLK